MDWELLELDLASQYGAGLVTAAVLVLSLVLLLPGERRRAAITPFAFLIAHVVIVAGERTLPKGSDLAQPLSLLALFCLLASIGRSGFLLFMYSVVVRRFARPLPKIFRDLIQALIYVAVALITLRAAGVDPGSLLTTSALLTAVIGLSLQDTLGNMFAGLAIQAQRPFEEGDWIEFNQNGQHIGEILEMNWRAVRLRTLEEIELTVPNSVLADAPIRNFSKPTTVARRESFIYAPDDMPPHILQQKLVAAVQDVPGVLERPAPTVLTHEFSERGVKYWVRYFIRDLNERENIDGEVRSRLWYALHREGIAIPPPQRTVRLFEMSKETIDREHQERLDARLKALKQVDFLQPLPQDALKQLAARGETRLYAPGELILREGEQGGEFFIIEWGSVQVLASESSSHVEAEVARLSAGQFFGEMSFMTGRQRVAMVRALEDTEIFVIRKETLRPILNASPDLADQISRVLHDREQAYGKKAAALALASEQSDQAHGQLLDRIRQFFSL